MRPRFRESGVEVIVDAALEGDYDKHVFTDMTNVALMCASFNKNDRPAMKVNYYSVKDLSFLFCLVMRLTKYF